MWKGWKTVKVGGIHTMSGDAYMSAQYNVTNW